MKVADKGQGQQWPCFFIDHQLKSWITRLIGKNNIKGKSGYRLFRENSRSKMCTFQTVLNTLAGPAKPLTGI